MSLIYNYVYNYLGNLSTLCIDNLIFNNEPIASKEYIATPKTSGIFFH